MPLISVRADDGDDDAGSRCGGEVFDRPFGSDALNGNLIIRYWGLINV